jgi:hypothetical protein
MRQEIRNGVVFFSAYCILQRFMVLPSILLGVIMGLSFSSFFIGFLPIKAYNFIRTNKKKIRHGIISRINNKKL